MLKLFLIDVRNYIKLLFFKSIWRKENKHNYTIPAVEFPIRNVKVGKYTYGDLIVRCFNNPVQKLVIGSFCSIASNVVFMLSGEHSYDMVSTYPFNAYLKKIPEDNNISKGDIIIGDDVWIGENCIILSGVTVGQGAVIGAGSIVTKDIPPYAIYGDFKVLKYRFNEDIRKRLVEFDFNKLDDDKIKKYWDSLHENVDNDFLNERLYLQCKKS